MALKGTNEHSLSLRGVQTKGGKVPFLPVEGKINFLLKGPLSGATLAGGRVPTRPHTPLDKSMNIFAVVIDFL